LCLCGFFLLSIETWFAFRPGLPSAVHPEPLIGMPAHEFFYYLIEAGGVQVYIFFHIAGIDYLYLGLEM